MDHRPVPIGRCRAEQAEPEGRDPHRPERAAAGTAAVLFVFFQDLLFDPRRFALHVRLLRGPMSENYQDYAGTPLGQWDLLKTLVDLLRFALNPALFAVCLAGLGWVLWRAFA